MKKNYLCLFLNCLTSSILFSPVIDTYHSPKLDNIKPNIISYNNAIEVPLKTLNKIINDEKNQYIFHFKADIINPHLKIYIIDENFSFSGPYFFQSNELITNPFTCKECSILIEGFDQSYNIKILDMKKPKPTKINSLTFSNKNINRDNPIILLTGFWPPTNEMIRHFSQNVSLNNSGWMGENWEESGYDVVSYFPEFSNPNCNNCGIGYGNFQVDYQSTSNDFWAIVDELSPIAIITFSRGYIDYSWEMEFNYYNRLNWINDYQSPFLPTPNPPDSDVESYFIRNSTLPMENIMDAINASNLNLDSYIDWNGNPGQFVSEFMGYHGVWYKDTHSFGENNCIIAGHIHVGGLIDWNTAKEAAEISLREVISYLDQFSYISGDVNSDNIIDILDVVLLVNSIIGVNELTQLQMYASDINGDGTINIQDIILIINIILS